MSDDHAQAHADAKADTHANANDNAKAKASTGEHVCRTDPLFEQVEKYVTGKIATFVAFLFLLITLGAFYAVVITGATLDSTSILLVLAPAIVGLVAYANRDIALIIFFFFALGLLFLF